MAIKKNGLSLGAALAALMMSAPVAYASDAVPVTAGNPITIDGVDSFPMRSAAGRDFTIHVYRPPQPPPPGGYPIAYFLDADASVGMMIDTANLLVAEGRMEPMAMVGIGVPRGDDLDGWYDRVARDRSYDYTPPVEASRIAAMNTETVPGGGAPDLLDFILDDLMPVVGKRLPVDRTRQLLTGHSYGGLFTLFALLERPDGFSSYLISSPSIWYGDGAVLAHRAGFDERLQRLSTKPRVVMAVGEDEEPNARNAAMLDRNPDYARTLRERKMVSRASDMADWLEVRGLPVNRRVAAHADHVTSKVVNLIHGLDVAWEEVK